MKGLDLSEKYFKEIGLPMLEAKFPAYADRIAAGLVGEGSECFGFDDEISRDHDWGPSFCLWLTKDDYRNFGAALQDEYDKLPKEFAGFEARKESDWGNGRTGVFEIGSFFKHFIGFEHVPENLQQWRLIPETHLAVATNGRIFRDPVGKLTEFRKRLKAFYPEDIRLKKIASRCMTIAQTGQYNYMRCVYRKDWIAAHLTEAKFMSDLISMVFLLNKAYKPFYKWIHRAVKSLPLVGNVIHKLISDLVTIDSPKTNSLIYEKKEALMNDACQYIIEELRRQRLSNAQSIFLLDHGPVVQSRIKDPFIRNLHVLAE